MSTTPEVADPPKSPIGRIFGVLAVLGAVAAFGLWAWFAVSDWGRIWNRIASTFGADRTDRASVLEVAWLAVGWAVGPALAALLIWTLGAMLDGLWRRISPARRGPPAGPRTAG